MQQQAIEALLPFFVNGSLNEDEHIAVEQALEGDAWLQKQVEALRHVRAEMQANTPQNPSAEFGLARLIRDIDAESPPLPANDIKPPLFRMSTFAGGLSAALIALAFIAGTVTFREAPVYVQASGVTDSAGIAVQFQSDVSQKLITEALLNQGLIIVDGPSARGVYHLALFEDGDLSALAEELRTQTTIFRFVDAP